jgi:spermidine synthase
MRVLHDAPGKQRRITVTEDHDTRYLLLDGCEEGAMALATEDPVFNYLWFHKCSFLVEHPLTHALVLGAGAFTAAKCLALDHPEAEVDAVDVEPLLETIGRSYFRLDKATFWRIRFRGCAAEDFLTQLNPKYDFVFDDLFDGYQHVPRAGRGAEHIEQLKRALSPAGVCIKNLIWNPLSADTRAACLEAHDAWRSTFASYGVIALGNPARGHNRVLIGLKDSRSLDWKGIRSQLICGGLSESLLEQWQWIV